MKKIICIVLLLCSFIGVSQAQTVWYRTTAYAHASVNYGIYTWGNWENSNMRMCIDWDQGFIAIYSPTMQKYAITKYLSKWTDSDGAEQTKFQAIDADGDVCTLRFRIPRSGSSQLYICFNNVAWVYNVVKVN